MYFGVSSGLNFQFQNVKFVVSSNNFALKLLIITVILIHVNPFLCLPLNEDVYLKFVYDENAFTYKISGNHNIVE